MLHSITRHKNYDNGEVGEKQSHFEIRKDVEQLLAAYVRLQPTPANQKAWAANERMISNHVINKRVVQLRMSAKSSYRKSRNGASELYATLRSMESEGVITRLAETDAITASNGAAYYTEKGRFNKAAYWFIDPALIC